MLKGFVQKFQQRITKNLDQWDLLYCCSIWCFSFGAQSVKDFSLYLCSKFYAGKPYLKLHNLLWFNYLVVSIFWWNHSLSYILNNPLHQLIQSSMILKLNFHSDELGSANCLCSLFRKFYCLYVACCFGVLLVILLLFLLALDVWCYDFAPHLTLSKLFLPRLSISCCRNLD